MLREHRGDGHIAALVAADIDAPEALALRAGVDLAANGSHGHVSAGWNRAQMQPARGWTDEEWDGAVARLAGRGLLRPDGAATQAGTELHREIEHATDVTAARPWAGLADSDADELAGLLLPDRQGLRDRTAGARTRSAFPRPPPPEPPSPVIPGARH